MTSVSPQSAKAGQAYPLVEKSNCRYASGVCDLENVEFRASLRYRDREEGGYLQLDASHPLSGVLVSIGLPGAGPAPLNMLPSADSAMRWTLALPVRPAYTSRIHLALSAAGSTYYVDASTAFLQQP